MKKIIGIMSGIILPLLFSTAKAQQTWDPKKNPTVDSITSAFEGKLLTTRPPITLVDIYPVIGTYESSANTEAPLVNISLDEELKGVVWIAGLPQGKIKAWLRKSPATYKIPAQKTENGKDVPEGTLIFDKEVNMLSINIGKPYNAEYPAATFLMNNENSTNIKDEEDAGTIKTKNGGKGTKTKEAKPWTYTGTKIEKTTASNQ